MRWFIGFHPKYQDEGKNLVQDFLSSGADILFTHLNAGDKITVNEPLLKSKVLIVFLENPLNDPQVWQSIPQLIENWRNCWGSVYIITTTDKRMVDIVKQKLSASSYVPLWANLPYTYRLYQLKVEPRYGDYLLAWVCSPLKGKKEIEAASVFVKIKIHDYSTGGPTIWSNEMMFESRGLIWAAVFDSFSRAFTSAAISRKPAIMLRTTAQLFDIYFDVDPTFLESIILCQDTWNWLVEARKILDNLDYAIEWGLKLYNFFERHEEFWKWEIVWQRFLDQTGIKIPKDMTPLHHFPPNYFYKEYFDDKEYFPQGPWSQEPPAVNWETGLGL